MICYDGWFPEVARGLAWLGAELIVQLAATPTADREQELILARADAIANQVYLMNVNAGRPEPSDGRPQPALGATRHRGRRGAAPDACRWADPAEAVAGVSAASEAEAR